MLAVTSSHLVGAAYCKNDLGMYVKPLSINFRELRVGESAMWQNYTLSCYQFPPLQLFFVSASSHCLIVISSLKYYFNFSKFIFKNFSLYWNIVVKCSVGFRCIAKFFSNTQVYIFSNLFPI